MIKNEEFEFGVTLGFLIGCSCLLLIYSLMVTYINSSIVNEHKLLMEDMVKLSKEQDFKNECLNQGVDYMDCLNALKEIK